MNTITFNIISGAAPFIVELVNSSIPNQTINSIGMFNINNVPNGYYTLRITDSNNCVFEENINVNSYVTTTTTTILPGSSIIVGHSLDPLLIFNENSTNRDSKFSGYPDPNIITLYLWFKTLDGKPLSTNKSINYSIGITGGTSDSSFLFNSVSDQIHLENVESNMGVVDVLLGELIFKNGFIESFYEYTYYKGITNSDYKIELESSINIFDNTLNTRIVDGLNYGIDYLDKKRIILNY